MSEHRYIWKKVNGDLYLGSFQPLRNPYWVDDLFNASFCLDEDQATTWLNAVTRDENPTYREVELYTITLTLSPMSVAEAKRRISPTTKG